MRHRHCHNDSVHVSEGKRRPKQGGTPPAPTCRDGKLLYPAEGTATTTSCPHAQKRGVRLCLIICTTVLEHPPHPRHRHCHNDSVHVGEGKHRPKQGGTPPAPTCRDGKLLYPAEGTATTTSCPHAQKRGVRLCLIICTTALEQRSVSEELANVSLKAFESFSRSSLEDTPQATFSQISIEAHMGSYMGDSSLSRGPS